MSQAPPARLPPALEPAIQRVRMAARSAAERTVDSLGLAALSSSNVFQRDGLLGAQFELNRKLAIFSLTFNETLDQRVLREVSPQAAAAQRATDWADMSLVDDHEVEVQVSADRFALEIQHQCEWEIRELDAYMGALLGLGRADHDRNPLRPEMVGLAMVRAVEAVAERPEVRKILATEIGRSLASSMRPTYGEIVADLRQAGVQPVGLTLRQVEGPGNQFGRYQSGYNSLQDEAVASAHGEAVASGSGPRGASGYSTRGSAYGGPGSAFGGGGGSAFGNGAGSAFGSSAGSAFGAAGGSAFGAGSGGGPRAAGGARFGPVDPQMMTLMRRLAHAGPAADSGADWGPDFGADEAAGAPYAGARAPVAPNLIVAHREELRQAATGQLDHMVIDVVGSLFDQILSDPKVAPQMARQIARLQLPVLRAALGDPSFFSSRRHPVRRFVNRIASVGCAFDGFDADDGRAFLALVKDLVQEIVEGDFEQIGLYEQKLARLEAFIADQAQRDLATGGGQADSLLASKESELRQQQRYATQLRAGLQPLPIAPFLSEFLASVWSQAIMLAVRRHGPAGELTERLRRAGRELVMSVQPKGSPAQRKTFLLGLPQLMKDLNTGLDLIRWPEAARKDFFAQLLPAHAESLKGREGLRTLDYNLLVKQVDAALAALPPSVGELPPLRAEELPLLQEAVTPAAFSDEEAQRIGLIDEAAIDWNGAVDIDLGAEAEAEPTEVDIQLEGLPPVEAVEPMRGKSLADHVQIGFAYQMHIDDGWHKVRLTHVSAGRSFFVFTRGHKHKRTISMTYRMLARLCETQRLRAFESGYLLERATARARRQLARLKPGTPPPVPARA